MFLFYLLLWLQRKLPDFVTDGGPLYYETPHKFSNAFFIEPWNAWSSLTFWIPVIYFIFRKKSNLKHHPFMVYNMFLLVVGGLGSTLYHGFRTSEWLLLMDVLPIVLLTVSVATYFWFKLFPKWPVAIVAPVVIIWFRYIISQMGTSKQMSINLSYILVAVSIVLPAIVLLYKLKWQYIGHFIFSVSAFGLALFFRFADDWPNQWLPMGVHWLWHVSCTVGVFPLGAFLFDIRDKNLSLIGGYFKNVQSK